MRVAIHQPQYLPWLGYFDKMDSADVFVILDDVQYKKNEWQNRNKIRTAEGWQWLTVPVLYKFGQKMDKVRIDNHRDWRARQAKSLEYNYSRAAYFSKYASFFQDLFEKDWDLIVDLNIYIINHLKETLGINTEVVNSSTLGVSSASTERLVEICAKLKADIYLSGAGGKEYLEQGLFKDKGIELEFQEYVHPEYDQVYKGFYPYMSVVDLLFCHGDGSLDIIKEGRKS